MSVHTKKGNVYCVYRDSQGKQIWEPFGKGTKALLNARERDLEIARKKQHSPALISANDLSFISLFNSYIQKRDIELSGNTIDQIYNTVTVYADPVIGKKQVRHINIDDWFAIQERMTERKISSRSINKYFQYLSKIITWGINNIQELRSMPNPWSNRKPLRIQKRFKIDLITLEELQKIIEKAPDHLKWAIEVEYNTGMRPGRTELFNLKWEDIDFETGAVRIYASKTDSYHTQYVSAAFLERLKEKKAWYRQEAERLAKRRKETKPECPYVIQYHGERITSQVSKSWREAKQAAGIEKRIRLYDIRHFYITHALRNGANILDLAERVGHQGPEMITRVYAHLVNDMSPKTALPIPELLPNGINHAKAVLDQPVRSDEKEAGDVSPTS